MPVVVVLKKSLQVSHESANLIIAACSMAVALLALVVTLVQISRANRIETLRWRPALATAIGNNEGSFEIIVENNGLGPAEIKWMDVYWKDKPVESLAELYMRVKWSSNSGHFI